MLPLLSKTAELIAGYSITERIGAGGYGEVWKADAPGGLTKAVKFVYGCLDDQRAAHELRALNRIKQVRHPFLLSLERIEVIEGQLVIITELADCSLKDRFEEHRAAGRPGIPRDELLVYLRDAADALDYMSQAHSLQHLDVKPENLLIVGGRVKVGDFGLVKDVCSQSISMLSGLTPVYAAPEVFEGKPSRHSDQYALAIVYQELLTGVFPFPGRTPSQLASQHLNTSPRLSVLPPADRPTIARALAKAPGERFESCRLMIESLVRPGSADASDSTGALAAGAQDILAADTASLRGPAQDTASKGPLRRARSTDSRTLALDALEEEDEVDEGTNATPRAAEQWVKSLTTLSEEKAPAPVDLPPLNVSTDDARLRPTLFLGIGGTALRTLGHIRHRLGDRFGDASALPAVRCLLVETDSKAVSAAIRPDGPVRLDPNDTIVTPLRRSQDYRSDSTELLRWLSRRWLFNIPRSLQTEGIRPLGRLALVDNTRQLREQIKTAITQVLQPEALVESGRVARMVLEPDGLRVYLVASVCGGAGGGMALDMAHLVREVLDEMDLPDARIVGVLTHSTPRVPHAKMLAMANTCASLSELYHDAAHPGGGPSPLDQTYLVHLGDDLDETRFDAATADLAEYLCVNVVTPAGAFFEAARKEQSDEQPAISLRTLALCQMGATSNGLPALAAETLVRSVLARWRGRSAQQPRSTGSGMPISPADLDDVPDLQLDVGQLAGEVNRIIENDLGKDVAARFRRGLESHLLKSRPEGETGIPYGILLEAVRNVLEPADPTSRLTEDFPQLSRESLDEHIGQMASKQGQAICRWIVELVETADRRLDSALEAAGWLAERLRQLESRLGVMHEHVQAAISQTERALAAGTPVESTRRGKGRRKQAVDALQQAEDYFRLRLDQLALDGTQTLLRSVRSRLAKVTDQLRDLESQLAGLARQFDTPTCWDALPIGAQPLPPVWEDLHRALAEQIHQQIPTLVGQLDRQFHVDVLDSHGGLFPYAHEGPGLDGPFLERLRRAARTIVAQSMRELDVARWIAGPERPVPTEDDSPTLIASSIELATPRLPIHGGTRRFVLACPESAALTLAESYQSEGGIDPTVIRDPSGNVILCCELAQLPLDHVAAAL
ncbi:MAG: protein kinase, partial [Pirellulales bacterium]|nr:protein kinase [Pirellulales bacterium]